MALRPEDRYPAQTEPASAAYPHGKARDVTVSGDGTGTPLQKDWLNDLWGFLQALLGSGDVTPSGTPDTVLASDYLEALDRRLGTHARYRTFGFRFEDVLAGGSQSLATEDNSLRSIAVSKDGRKLFVLGSQNDKVYSYTLSTPFDVTTATYDSVFLSVSAQTGTSPVDVKLNTTGTKLYVSNSTGFVYQYTLSTAFDLSTATYASISLDVSAQASPAQGFAFSADGTKLYVTASTTGFVYQYTLSTAFDLSTATYASISLDVSATSVLISAVAISTDGTKFFICFNGSSTVRRYTLGTPYDVSTATYDSVVISITGPTGIAFDQGGSMFYNVGPLTNIVEQRHVNLVVALGSY